MIVNSPRQLYRRPEVLGFHPDLRDREELIQMADCNETFRSLVAMAEGLREYFGDGQPVCVPIKRGASGTMNLLRSIDSGLFANVQPMAISTTNGKQRLPEPIILEMPSPQAVENKQVLIIDGVGDTLKTLRLAVDSVRRLCDGTNFLPPVGVIACVAVLKQGAAKVEVPELTDAAMLADKDDWVVGIGAAGADGFDLDDRFRDLTGVWHIQVPPSE
ncbi:hypothetical protein HYU89_00180 [Candidatus Collierbacteria bacterium]|nr:hypothetical protein [Candidatus Collierbacteria bacterium]